MSTPDKGAAKRFCRKCWMPWNEGEQRWDMSSEPVLYDDDEQLTRQLVEGWKWRECSIIAAAPECPTPAGSGDVVARDWYIGAMNDGLFVIDQPPRPSTDYPVHDSDVNCIAAVPFAAEKCVEELIAAHNSATASLREELAEEREVRDAAFEAIKKLVIRAQELDRFWREATDNNEFLRREQDAMRRRVAELEADKRRLDNGLCVALQGLERIQRRAFGRETPQSIELQNMAGDTLAAVRKAMEAKP